MATFALSTCVNWKKKNNKNFYIVVGGVPPYPPTTLYRNVSLCKGIVQGGAKVVLEMGTKISHI